jgi:hypothetical protein
MKQAPTGQSVGMRALQGVILGLVLTIPVVLWAYTRTRAVQEPSGNPVVAIPNEVPAKAASKASSKRRIPVSQAADQEVETIPASEMHIRIDDGSRPSQASGSTVTAKPAAEVSTSGVATNKDEDQDR